MNRINNNPIFITGAERSGSTLIARILDLCGAQSGRCNNMFENRSIVECNLNILAPFTFSFPDSSTAITIPKNWRLVIDGVRTVQGDYRRPWFIKHPTLARLWPVYYDAYPNSKWLIIRRRTGDVIQSCLKTGHMRLFKQPEVLAQLGLTREDEGWLWWIHKYEERFVEMTQAGLDVQVVWPDRMVFGDYKQMQEIIEWLGLTWNERVPAVIDPLLEKSREVML